jgi:hypothetical protein
MHKTATFTWTVTVDIRDDFDSEDPERFQAARREAWMNVHESTGELTDEEDEDESI